MNKIETYKVQDFYEYMLQHHLGREHGITKPELAADLNISTRDLRRLTKAVNESAEFSRLVSTTHCCYLCNTKDECRSAIKNTYRVAIALFKKAKKMEKKVGLNGQMKLKLGDDFRDIVETFEE